MYRINRRQVVTNEEKAAKRISQVLTDFTLDLEKVGYHIARSNPYILYRRSTEVLEAAKFQEDIVEQNRIGYNDTLF
jgi:hypothetical protein